MAASVKYVVFLCMFMAASSVRPISSSSASSVSTCRPQSDAFVYDLLLQCPDTISSSPPIEMDGESLDRTLNSSPVNIYMAVLFHASCCPFSRGVRPKFFALSSLFPQIKHVMIEQSAAMPSVLSRYGIHSLPAIMLVNNTEKVRHHGRKDLRSLVQFYKRTTGLGPVVHFTGDQIPYSDSQHEALESRKQNSIKEILVREPYLVFSTLFIFFRALLYFFPQHISQLIALWFASIPHFNWGIFGESCHLVGRVIHLIDLKGMWSKLNPCKTRKFDRARSTRVWASSFASVSLGERSTRSFASGDF